MERNKVLGKFFQGGQVLRLERIFGTLALNRVYRIKWRAMMLQGILAHKKTRVRRGLGQTI
jgi:hypothetical protein